VLIRSRAPLRLGFGGGGTDLSPFCDLYGGCVLNATIDMYAHSTVEPADDGRLTVIVADQDKAVSVPMEPRPRLPQPFDLHAAVYSRVVRQFGDGRPFACRIVTFCDAPPGSGLGSSSTVVVSMLKAFVELLKLPVGEYEIAQLAFEIERKELGLSGGRQDQYAATFGGFNFMEFYADERVIVNPLRIKNWIISELETSLVLFYTGVSRSSAKIIDEQQANVKAERQASIEAMHELKRDAVGMKECVLRGDLRGFAGFMRKSWEAKKRTAASVSNNRIDAVYETALEAGALAGKVSGAGGGGFIMFLVDPPRRMNVVRALERQDGRVMTCHFTRHGTEGWRID
jgi:D-glycero-alpha-D-manno-heptose-7-phosphate kinase